MTAAPKTLKSRKMPNAAVIAGAADCSAFIESIFGKQRTKVEVSDEAPTMHLRWHKGVLQQLWEITERHMHYSGDHYNDSTYHKREKWRAVAGTPNDPSSATAADGDAGAQRKESNEN
jgi:hypothetical protein